MTTQAKEKPWYAAFPTPSSTPGKVTREEVHDLIANSASGPSSKDFLVVDVRRTDFEDGFIAGAINLPAHSFYQTIPSLLPILSEYPRVIFHCQSSTGRGPRVAGWYQDALDAAGITSSRGEVLVGGIKGWLERYTDEADFTRALPAGEGEQ